MLSRENRINFKRFATNPSLTGKENYVMIRKILKLGILIALLLISAYLLYLSSRQDYKILSPTKNLGRPSQEKPEEYEDDDYMDFIRKPPIELPRPF